ncbi:hypothetical protein JYK22_07695, partial [Nonomuraea sp. RK-328]|nr:hypothetical protein [Nonomuraea sp. RK-328]
MKALAAVVAFLRWFVIASVVLAGVGAGLFYISVLSYGCGAKEDRMAEAMVTQAVFAQRPAGVRPEGPPETSCDDDDLLVIAERAYRLPPARVDALAFYGAVAAGDGWKPSDEPGLEKICYSKAIDGEVVDMELSVDDSDRYTVSLTWSSELASGC